MSQTTKELERVKEALSNMRIVPVDIKAADRPMIHILKGLVKADNYLFHEADALNNLQNRIKEVLEDIKRYTEERAEYSKILNTAYTKEEIESFLKRVEDEHEKWTKEMDKKEKVASTEEAEK